MLPDSAAARAGIQADDRILSIAGTPVASFEDIQRIITAHPAETLPITIRRGERTLELPVLTDARESGGRKVGMLGIRGGQVEYQRLTPARGTDRRRDADLAGHLGDGRRAWRR